MGLPLGKRLTCQELQQSLILTHTHAEVSEATDREGRRPAKARLLVLAVFHGGLCPGGRKGGGMFVASDSWQGVHGAKVKKDPDWNEQ